MREPLDPSSMSWPYDLHSSKVNFPNPKALSGAEITGLITIPRRHWDKETITIS
jgi:hypothetical protein